MGAFDLVEACTTILLRAGLNAQAAADAVDNAARLVIGHTLAEAARPPGGELGGGEDEHVQAEQQLPADRYPSLTAIHQAGVHHDPDRLFESALNGLIRNLEPQLPSRD